MSEHQPEGAKAPGQPDSPVSSGFQDAFEHHVRGRLAEADAGYRALLQRSPDHVDGLHFRGILLHQAGQHEAALELIRKAISLAPGQGAAHSNLGVVLLALNRPGEALQSFDRAQAIHPESAEALVNRGNALQALERSDEALQSYDRALAVNPGLMDAVLRRGQVLISAGRFDEALAGFDRALVLSPDLPALLSDRGGVLIEMKRYEEAVGTLQKAVTIDPDNAAALSNLGGALVELKRQGEALVSLDRALALEPDSVNALFNRGTALRDLKRPKEAVESYERLLAIQPDYPYAAGYLFYSKRQCCDWTDFADSVKRLESAVLAGQRVDAPFSFLAVSNLAGVQLRCARSWVADKCRPRVESGRPAFIGKSGRVRIAYLSADFGDHPVAYSIVELFETHDRSRFEVFGVSFGPDNSSAMRERVQRSVDRFIDVRGKSDREVVGMLRELEIDIAVDLNGYTLGNRAIIFAHRVAPVQVSYLGFSGSTGADYMDYIIADNRVIPPGQEIHYSEQVVRLPDTFLVNDRRRATAGPASSREAVGLPAYGFVFCCFNNSYKITPAVFDIWMRLLARVESSVLWLFEDNPAVPENLRREAEARGIPAGRLVFARRTSLLADHLARYRLADLFLDTLPYNAHVTTIDALWTGLPVLTCMGSTFAGRVAGSLLHAIGLPELVAGTHEEYEALACRLASEPAKLAELRTRLAANRLTWPLFDTDRFRGHIEQAYLQMHERSMQGRKPAPISIDPAT